MKLAQFPFDELPARDGDEHLSHDQLARLDIFARIKSPPNFERLAKAAVLRRYQQNDVICRQGEQANSAFYVLLSEDVLKLKNRQLEKLRREYEATAENRIEISERIQNIKSDIGVFKNRTSQDFAAADGERPPRQAATAHLLTGPSTQARPKGLFGRLNRKMFGGSKRVEQPPEFIPNDGPTDIPYQTKQAPLFEGEVFGEMSCKSHAPRSATVIAETDCFALEFLRPVCDALHSDSGYRKRVDRNYRDRVLKGHLQRLDLLKDLTDAEFEIIREQVRLEFADPGEVICDANDPSDAAYIVKSGLVQVLVDLNVTLKPEDISDWQSFCKELTDGAA